MMLVLLLLLHEIRLIHIFDLDYRVPARRPCVFCQIYKTTLKKVIQRPPQKKAQITSEYGSRTSGTGTTTCTLSFIFA